MEDWAQWATALVAVLAYRWGWSRGARKMAAAMAGRMTASQKFRVWLEEKFTPTERPAVTMMSVGDMLRAHKQQQDQKEDGHAGHAPGPGDIPRSRGQYL